MCRNLKLLTLNFKASTIDASTGSYDFDKTPFLDEIQNTVVAQICKTHLLQGYINEPTRPFYNDVRVINQILTDSTIVAGSGRVM